MDNASIKSLIQKELTGHKETINAFMQSSQETIYEISHLAINTIKNGNTIFLCGNGGSAADSQHIAAELTGRYKKERKGLSAIALTTDTSALSAIGNDYGYDEVFARQLDGLAKKGDMLIGISTSGNSANIIKAFKKAKSLGCTNIGFSGKGGGDMNKLCDINLIVPSDDTPRIQEMHILAGHIICNIIEDYAT